MKYALRRRIRILILLLAGGLLWHGCGSADGGAEAGNPNRTVIGSVSSSSIPALGISSVPVCGADEVVATDSNNQSLGASVAADCSFRLTLLTPQAYRLDFQSGGQTISSMEFNNSPDRFPSPVMNLSPGSDTLTLNHITLKGGLATPSREPASQNDQDGDGVPDLLDDDDDNDGILDEDERDCDLDGILDDFDSDMSSCRPTKKVPRNFVLEVTPRNGEGSGDHGITAGVDAEIKLRLSCPIDQTSIAASTLQIFPQDVPTNVLECVFSLTESGDQLRCDHPDLLANTVYSAHFEGLLCEDGSGVPAAEWSWTTQ